MARLSLPRREDLSAEVQARWDVVESEGMVRELHRLFFSNPEIPLIWNTIWAASGLSVRARELVILRCALLRRSTYEWHAHVGIARAEAGLSDEEIRAVADWRSHDGFSSDERALLAYADALADGPTVEDELFEQVRHGRSLGDVLGITYLITIYFQLATVLTVFDLQPEEGFVGWALESR